MEDSYDFRYTCNRKKIDSYDLWFTYVMICMVEDDHRSNIYFDDHRKVGKGGGAGEHNSRLKCTDTNQQIARSKPHCHWLRFAYVRINTTLTEGI